MHKSYLKEISAAGIRTVPTIWLPQGDNTSFKELLKHSGWDAVVIKPAVSQNAYETWMVHARDSKKGQTVLGRLTTLSDVMIQPFHEPIVKQGEWSLIFLNSKYSHAVMRWAKKCDFRVQSDFGGNVEAVSPPRSLVTQAREVIGLLREAPLYARVDGVFEAGALVVTELELVTPELFFRFNHEAPRRFVDALVNSLNSRTVF
jgi:hypothetical protein